MHDYRVLGLRSKGEVWGGFLSESSAKGDVPRVVRIISDDSKITLPHDSGDVIPKSAKRFVVDELARHASNEK